MKKRSLALSIVAAVTVGVLGLTGCTDSGSSTSGSTKTISSITIAVAAVTPKWDPATFDWGYQLQPQQAAYDTLIHETPDGTFTAGLATKWAYTNSREFTLTLRQGVTFTDGTPFNAEAVKANIEHDKAVSGPKTALLASVSSVSVSSKYVAVVHLSAPNPVLPYIFSEGNGMMASPKAIKNLTSLDQTPVGAGPYTLDASKTVPTDHYTFVKNPKYWDAKNVPYQTIIFKVMSDPTVILNALRTGQIDMGVGSAGNAAAAKSAGLNVLKYSVGVWGILFEDRNGTMVPALKSVKVRQALNYAVDRKPIATSVVPGVATSQIFGPGDGVYDPKLNDYYTYNPTKAKQLLAAAGYPNGFVLPVLSTPGADGALQAFAADLAKVGVTVQIEDRAPLDYVTGTYSGKFPAFIQPFASANGYIDMQSWLLPTGPQNPFKVNDPALIDLYKTAETQTGAEQVATYQKLAAGISKEALFVPLLQGTNFYFYDKKIAGLTATTGQVVPFIYNWKPAN
jgi:peptide/nickel transport system substrate-binding protein